MTKINEKALVVIKQKFQDENFILIEGAIYKKIITKRVEIQGKTVNVGKLKDSIIKNNKRWHKEELEKI